MPIKDMGSHSPRERGHYRDRDLDCQEAIEPEFLRYAYGGTAFIDMATIKKGLVLQAMNAGWAEAEVDTALVELSRCHARYVKAAALTA